ncbi:MAG: hypothetical protein H6807_04125 [Planctomycetes bacterium]|nr:hypothetical protein [Planctomycetota bacterium]
MTRFSRHSSGLALPIGRASRLIACLLPLLAGACAAPLVVGVGRPEPAALPLDAEAVACRTSDGLELRGFHLRAEPESALVLHLLPRGMSATCGLPGFAGFRETLATFRDRGLSSLVIDYRGVGASAGEVDADGLGRDALAIWAVAQRLAGGREERVLIRAASLGSLAAAAIIDGGARPRALVLAAPVDAATVVDHAARAEHGALLGALLAACHRAPPVAPLAVMISAGRVPTLLLVPEDDPLLPTIEIDRLESAGRDRDDLRLLRRDEDHQSLVLRFWGFELDEEGGRLRPEPLIAETDFLAGLGLWP